MLIFLLFGLDKIVNSLILYLCSMQNHLRLSVYEKNNLMVNTVLPHAYSSNGLRITNYPSVTCKNHLSSYLDWKTIFENRLVWYQSNTYSKLVILIKCNLLAKLHQTCMIEWCSSVCSTSNLYTSEGPTCFLPKNQREVKWWLAPIW